MPRYSAALVYEAINTIVGNPELSRIMSAAIMSESGGDTDAVGDNGDSLGWYQINKIHGLSDEQRRNPAFATRWMLTREFQRAYDAGQAAGYTGEQLARWTCMAAERPDGWQGPNGPGLDSAAADRYAEQWHALEDTMPTDTATATYDSSTRRVAQTDDWSCSVAAATWALRSLGVTIEYRDMEQREQDAGIVSIAEGLRDATGGPLADWLAAEFGLMTGYDAGVRWAWLVEHAGQFPILLGGRRWGRFGHWVGVRAVEDGVLTLANPAEGYAGIFETLTEREFYNVGPCSAVWLAPEEDMAEIARLNGVVADQTNLLGNIQGDWVDAAIGAIEAAQATGSTEERNALLASALDSLATIKRGGPPEVVGA
jgi:hypothetical protein